MNKKEIIELLQDRAMVGRMAVRDKQLMLEAADTIESLCNKDCCKQEWISVDERSPEKHGKYVVYRNFYHSGSSIVDIIAYDPDYDGHAMWYFFDSECGDCEVSGVTHWMPLPEAPKGGEE